METFLTIIDILLTSFIFFAVTYVFVKAINFGKRIRELEESVISLKNEVDSIDDSVDSIAKSIASTFSSKRSLCLDFLTSADLGRGKIAQIVGYIGRSSFCKWDALLDHLGIEWEESKTKEGFVKKKKEKKV